MPQTKTAIEGFALADWKNAGGGGNSTVAQDHAAIVQRGFRLKKGEEQFRRKRCIDDHSRFFIDLD